MIPWILLAVRVLIGLLFVFVGAGKLLSPYQNFQYVIQHYQFFPQMLEEPVARIFPWIELFAGLFLIAGLWLRPALMVLGGCVAGFIIIIGQALARGLPIDDCGCFGDAVSLKPSQTLILDLTLMVLIIWMLRSWPAVRRWSVDRFYE